MPKVLCPICGRAVDRLIEGMCEECYLSRHPVLEIKNFNVVRCKYCGAYYIRGRWVKPKRGDDRELLERLLRDNIDVKGALNAVQIEVYEDRVVYNIAGVGTPHELIKPREFQTSYVAPFLLDVCPDCRRNIWGVERGLVRIKGYPEDLGEIEYKKIESVLEHVLYEARGRNIGSVISIERTRDGVEVLTTEPKLARHIAHKIHQVLPSDYVESYKVLKGRGDKKVYHYTATVYVITLEEGDVVRRGPSYYLVIDVNNREVVTVDVASKAQVRFPLYRFTEVKTEKVAKARRGVGGEGLGAPGGLGVVYYVEIDNKHYIVPI